MGNFLLTLLMVVSVLLMFVILLQRGGGGGVAGTFGEIRAQSVCGTNAGNVITAITIVTAIIWVILACVTGWWLRG
jgi:preprotein translocase subunit SecG